MISQQKHGLALDGSAHEGWAKLEEEVVTSIRPELAALARTLQTTSGLSSSARTDLLYVSHSDSETTQEKVSRCICRGPRTTLEGDANADIMKRLLSNAYVQDYCEEHAHSCMERETPALEDDVDERGSKSRMYEYAEYSHAKVVV